MKLYSKHHLVCAALASAVIGLIAGAALMNARNGEAYLEAPESTEQAVQTVESSSENSGSAEKETASQAADENNMLAMAVAAKNGVGYTEDEAQNVGVYE